MSEPIEDIIKHPKFEVGQKVYPLFLNGTKTLWWVHKPFIIIERIYKGIPQGWVYYSKDYDFNNPSSFASAQANFIETFLYSSEEEVFEEIRRTLNIAYEDGIQ